MPSAQEQAEALKDKARNVADNAMVQGKGQIDRYSDKAANEIETVANSFKAAASELSDQDRAGLSGYVSDIAQSMAGLADTLRGKSADELIQEAGRLARENPALFLTSSIAIGFGLSRFAKASSRKSTSTDSGMSTSGAGMDSELSSGSSYTARAGATGETTGTPSTLNESDKEASCHVMGSSAAMGTTSSVNHAGMGAFEGADGTRTIDPASQTSTPVIAEKESTYQGSTSHVSKGDTTATTSVVRPVPTSDLGDTPSYGSPALDPDRASTTALGNTKKDTNGGL
ncbi:hypothetical protein ACFQDN_16580 [Pseudomonas asuensis]|uniref:Uncharacterized protein n=2 Tax=Pseudomonas asuensis TaxID=1825787 RepID=A0ABQ2GLX6_9PSED|nr:hypothetical protein GCM10009425_11470 [Pseudomonas asuensis]